MTKQNQISKSICDTIERSPSIPVSQISRKKHHTSGNYNSGIYFIYDNNSMVVYIGKVSSAKTASLYMRIIGNVNSAHKRKYFHRLANLPYIKEAV